jgi:phosphatidylserine/phosphatidylglycerophosphate/cardiolipin synthase-like enzyme/uncharacterized membrane protein YdjX (TVP38/TMEM64 family)
MSRAVARAKVEGSRRPTDGLVRAGENCWRVARADHFYCIQDAADCFRLVREALLAARRTVFVLGWDIAAHVELLPDAPASGAPTRLDKLLVHAAQRRPRLRCYILTWDYGALYTLERDPLSRWRLGWRMPRAIRFGFDDHHPVGGAHHQKLVVVDDELAFCGGIDLTGHRWDTSAHRVDEPARKNLVGKPYGPYHDVQAMVDGPVAASLGELARMRWRAFGASRLPKLGAPVGDLWPASALPDLTAVDVGIARTMPGHETEPPIRECEALFLDSIAAAKQAIYIESQYFTSEKLAGALAARLQEPDGPEVVLVTPQECHGWLEQTTMGVFRTTAFRQLIAADLHKRLRIVHPVASRTRDVPVFVHSKVMVVDDRLARIGSANFSQRSMGVDSECDLAAEAGADPEARDGVRRIRDRLLGEHLGLSAEAVPREIEQRGSLCALIDAHAHGERALVRLQIEEETSPPPALLRVAADPDEPIAFAAEVNAMVPAVDARRNRRPIWIWILPTVALAAASAVAWRSLEVDAPALQDLQQTLASIPHTPASLGFGVLGFVLAAALLVPLELLAIAAGGLFGFAGGSLVALGGAFAAAMAGYAAGRAIGDSGLVRWMSRRSYRSGRQLRAQGLGGVIALRLSALASAGAAHLLCGAARIPFGTYMAGTVIALSPAAAALAGLGALLRATLLSPSVSTAGVTIGAALLLMAVAAGLRALLVLRQFAPSMSRHRDRAEFG